MWKFILQEWKYWLRAPMTWVFLIINTMLITGAVASDNIIIGDSAGSVHKNAPFVIQNYYGIMSLVCLLMTTAYMNASANRDFAHGMYQFVFSSPIKKYEYFFGKFIGAASMAFVPLLGISIGGILGPLIPGTDPERYGEIIWSGHLNGIIAFGLPNIIITSVMLFGLAIVFRSNIVSFVGAMLILIMYVIAIGYTKDLEKEWLANILDPFGFNPQEIMSKYMTVEEKNTMSIQLVGPFLLNRIFWLSVAFIMLMIFYYKFSFTTKKAKNRAKAKPEEKTIRKEPAVGLVLKEPTNKFSVAALIRMVIFELKTIVMNPTFIILVSLGIINLIASLTSFTSRYGLEQFPVTYNVIDSIKGGFYIYLLSFITFYSGVLVWREKDCRINDIVDATPIKSFMILGSKLIALVLSVALILTVTIIVGMLSQIMHSYIRLEPGVYFTSLLVYDLLSFTYLIIISLLFHYLINNRYIAYFAFVAFIILNQFIWRALQINSNMLSFGSTPRVTYSDMNGFGPFLQSSAWFNIYWSLFSILLLFVIRAFYLRGRETAFIGRTKKAGGYFKQSFWPLAISILLFIGCAAFVYRNTVVINKFESESEQENKQVSYEKKYKKYEDLPKPRYYKYKYNIDIYPEERNLQAKVLASMRNTGSQNISELHFTLPLFHDTIKINIKGAKLKLDDEKLGYRIYKLQKALQPGDSLEVEFCFSKFSKGFENEVSFLELTHNGSFFNNTDITPQLGYVEQYEIQDKNKRRKLKLPEKRRMQKLNEFNAKARSNNYISSCSDWVEVNSVISTSAEQIAIAPGSLCRKWSKNNRNYFEYKLDKPSLDFYSFMSGKYEVARKKWKDIDLEVYYIKEHAYNVPNMLKSMEKSLDYFTSNFGKYYHQQCRIIEFPRYRSFAQAFPGTMPYSESIGFIADLRGVKENDIDLVFYVVAHEMGHQYWAHQLCGAAMQGSEWMSEGFAQYSALMVMEKEYGRDRMKRFLKYEMDDYLKSRGEETQAEQPLYKTENQPYIHYQKASVAMYYMKELISEEKMNQALSTLIDSFAYAPPPYATSMDALRAIKKVTPDSLMYAVTDLFETITLFSNKVVEAKTIKKGDGFETTLIFQTEKFRADSLGNEKETHINDYIDIACFGIPENDDELGKKLFYKRYKINQKENKVVFQTKEKPFKAGVDPYNYLIDRVPEDNLKRVTED
jgi:ABC-2 type transport system permease protein